MKIKKEVKNMKNMKILEILFDEKSLVLSNEDFELISKIAYPF